MRIVYQYWRGESYYVILRVMVPLGKLRFHESAWLVPGTDREDPLYKGGS